MAGELILDIFLEKTDGTQVYVPDTHSENFRIYKYLKL